MTLHLVQDFGANLTKGPLAERSSRLTGPRLEQFRRIPINGFPMVIRVLKNKVPREK
jgi:hypothetical protein